ncbi:hypothetical protein H2514_09830 [Lysobacter sp. CW239]|jgi:hypothetical protein|uniref:hypothetical protein n=1 Tax=Lysobacteraceae TaxID=32033 RepID=UPI0005660451|nr:MULTISPECIES: hypothetical protein [Lysobacter]QOD90502.1 hypothetical protein H2514_09830 [Lysobacter sp. CW239]
MHKNRSPKDHELYRRTDEVLHYLWDPCGISDAPQARDEYSSYLPSVYSLLHDGADAHKIASLLREIEGKYMGLSGNTARNQTIGTLLVEWREHIHGDAV